MFITQIGSNQQKQSKVGFKDYKKVIGKRIEKSDMHAIQISHDQITRTLNMVYPVDVPMTHPKPWHRRGQQFLACSLCPLLGFDDFLNPTESCSSFHMSKNYNKFCRVNFNYKKRTEGSNDWLKIQYTYFGFATGVVKNSWGGKEDADVEGPGMEAALEVPGTGSSLFSIVKITRGLKKNR